MTTEPHWCDSFDKHGRWDWTRFPYPRSCVPVLLPFACDTPNAWERETNDRVEGLTIACMVECRTPTDVEKLLALFGPFLHDGGDFPPPLRKRDNRGAM